MKKEITFLMDEKRNLYVLDSDGVEYDFWALGWGIPVSLMVQTKAEQEESERKRKEREKEERFESAKKDFENFARPWYKKIFN